MPATLTSAAVHLGAPYVTEGVNVAMGRVELGVTPNGPFSLSTGDVIQMVKLPTGAQILRIQVACGLSAFLTEGAISVGDGSSTARFMTATSLTSAAYLDTAANTFGGGAALHYTISRSDAVVFLGDTIDISIGGAASTTSTGTFVMAVWFLMPPYAPG